MLRIDGTGLRGLALGWRQLRDRLGAIYTTMADRLGTTAILLAVVTKTKVV
jgi:hypothetical protein